MLIDARDVLRINRMGLTHIANFQYLPAQAQLLVLPGLHVRCPPLDTHRLVQSHAIVGLGLETDVRAKAVIHTGDFYHSVASV